MDRGNEEIRRLQRELEFFTSLINNHQNQLNPPGLTNVSGKLRTSVVGSSGTKGSNYRWTASSNQSVASQKPTSHVVKNNLPGNNTAPKTVSHNPAFASRGLSVNEASAKQHEKIVKEVYAHEICPANKYKLVRQNGDNVSKSVISGPHSSSSTLQKSSSVVENKDSAPSVPLKSVKSLSTPGKKSDVVHQSKYKFVKNCQADQNNSTGLHPMTLPSSPKKVNARTQLMKVDQSNDRGLNSQTSVLPNSEKTGLSSASNFKRVTTLASQYKLVKKDTSKVASPQIKNAYKSPSFSFKEPRFRRISEGKRANCSWLSGSKAQLQKKKSWNTKYSLQRQNGDSAEDRNCINTILGRQVKNLSSNMYKFINAKQTVSSKPSTQVNRKRRTLKIDRRPQGLSSQFRVNRAVTYSKRRSSSSYLSKAGLSGHQKLVKSSLLVRPVSRSSLSGKKNPSAKGVSLSGDASKRYCLYYNRFGRCSRGDKCQYIHDPDKVSVCTRFLRGTCKVTDCPFSHKVAKHKMPVCRFFLRCACYRDDCPYSHVNVGKDAEICRDFLNGFCSSGDSCKKKHMIVCSDFTDTGSCPRGSDCPMLHRKKRTRKPTLGAETEAVAKKPKIDSCEESTTLENTETKDGTSSFSDDDDANLPWKDRHLPSFIALNKSVEDPLTITKLKASISDPGLFIVGHFSPSTVYYEVF